MLYDRESNASFLPLIIFLVFTAPCVKAAPCIDHGPNRGLQALKESLLIPVSIIGDDDGRLPISKSYSVAGLSKSEYRQSLVSVGMIQCLKSKTQKSSAGVGTVVLTNDQVVTSAHVLEDEFGNLRDNLGDCVFLNNANPFQYHKIVVDHIVRGSKRGNTSISNDYVILRLVPPVREAKPYQIDLKDSSLNPGQKIYMMSNTIENHKFGHEPKLQACSIMQNIARDSNGGAGFKTDCSSEPGDSGSPSFIRDDSGKLVLKGLLRGEAIESYDHCAYDSEACNSGFTQLTGEFLRDLGSHSL